jgi:hypothetical protein
MESFGPMIHLLSEYSVTLQDGMSYTNIERVARDTWSPVRRARTSKLGSGRKSMIFA